MILLKLLAVEAGLFLILLILGVSDAVSTALIGLIGSMIAAAASIANTLLITRSRQDVKHIEEKVADVEKVVEEKRRATRENGEKIVIVGEQRSGDPGLPGERRRADDSDKE